MLYAIFWRATMCIDLQSTDTSCNWNIVAVWLRAILHQLSFVFLYGSVLETESRRAQTMRRLYTGLSDLGGDHRRYQGHWSKYIHHAAKR